MKYLQFLFIAIFSFITIQCSDDDGTPKIINEEEAITDVEITVMNTTTLQEITYIVNEENNDGTFEIPLDENENYTFSVRFLNKSNLNDIKNITEEVIAESDEHFIFYETTTSNLTISYNADDTKDSNNENLGLIQNISTGNAETITVDMYLIHEPATKTGTTRNNFGGETDVQIRFKFVVE
ncbi:MAG: hypothetical protein H6604_08240 [Flavobacteriales bacterium]|nr:hypothetical protein [Flavobacteriales bacterium]